MKVILQQDIKSVGKKGDIVEVSEGYGRNFLLPKKFAIEATAVKLWITVNFFIILSLMRLLFRQPMRNERSSLINHSNLYPSLLAACHNSSKSLP